MRISDWSSDVCSSDLQAVAQVRIGVIADIVDIDRGIGRRQRDDHQEAGFLLVHLHADLAHLLGQSRFGERDAILHQNLRSEEHTSELQSLMRISYAVFCLKKKQNKKKVTTIPKT